MIQLPTPAGATLFDAPGPTPSGVVALGPATVRFTGTREGDMADPSGTDPVVRTRRLSVVARPWSWLTQVHGAAVALVDSPGGAAGLPADATVSVTPGVALAILTADCAPVAFASPEGVIGIAHAGWRGLAAGVIEETVAAMRALGARSVTAALGPCIHAECYGFGPADLDTVAARYGPTVRSETSAGQPSLDIPQAVRQALLQAGAELVADADICTSCSAEHWSWRARQDLQRQATVIWRS